MALTRHYTPLHQLRRKAAQHVISKCLDASSISCDASHVTQMRWVQTPSLLPFPDLTQPEVAYPLYVQPEVNPRYVSRIDGVYLQNLDMDELIEKVRSSLRPLSV